MSIPIVMVNTFKPSAVDERQYKARKNEEERDRVVGQWQAGPCKAEHPLKMMNEYQQSRNES